MAGITLVVANGNWPQSDLVETLLEMADFTIALDGAADKFTGWDIVIGDMDSISNPKEHKANQNQENTDLAKALEEFDVDAVVGIGGGRLDHRLGVFSALFETGSDAILYFEGWRACRVDKSGLEIELKKGQGIFVESGKKHQFKNLSNEPIDFLVISSPESHNDRILPNE